MKISKNLKFKEISRGYRRINDFSQGAHFIYYFLSHTPSKVQSINSMKEGTPPDSTKSPASSPDAERKASSLGSGGRWRVPRRKSQPSGSPPRGKIRALRGVLGWWRATPRSWGWAAKGKLVEIGDAQSETKEKAQSCSPDRQQCLKEAVSQRCSGQQSLERCRKRCLPPIGSPSSNTHLSYKGTKFFLILQLF